MIAFGSYVALNLDGGGSTALVRSDGNGGAVDFNRPSGGTERYDANDLGVFALALPTPEPAMWVPVGVCLLFAAVRTRRRF